MAKRIYFFGAGQADGDAKQKELLGGKGAGLAEMTRLGIPVPPGFTITTEVCNGYYGAGSQLPDGFEDELKGAISRVGELVGVRFGDAENPLLVSVRSGARASMPGMMDTILNLGMNQTIVEGLSRRTGNPRFALDAYRRFIKAYAEIVLDVDKEKFEHALVSARRKAAAGVGVDESKLNDAELERAVPDSVLGPDALAAICADQRRIVLEVTGSPFPDDPFQQLVGAIRAVFGSWMNDRAKYYRNMHGIPESWGTACNVQAMVFGNMGDDSGTGVAFTRNPSTGERKVYGEWLPNAQGEDVVAGVRTPYPIERAGAAEGEADNALELRSPAVYVELMAVFAKLEKHFRDMQDLEFTIQGNKLYMLQARSGKRTGPAAVRMAVEMVAEGLISQDEALQRVDAESLDQLLHPRIDPGAPKRVVARGLAASPGAASGKVCLSANEAEALAAKGEAVILVRIETSPEDIHGMNAAKGILTAKGGKTSHAAVVARGMGKCCVAGCSALDINYEAGTVAVTVYDKDGANVETVKLKTGDIITLDGSTGEVFLGAVKTLPASISGEFGTLMEWADKTRRLKVRTNADTPKDAKVARSFGAQGIGLCRTEHMFFDEQRIAAMREMILSADQPARRRALAKLLPYQREDFLGLFREMAGLPVTIRLLDPPLHEFLPTKREQIEELAKTMGVTVEALDRKNVELHESNPMLGHRGCRLAITYPEICEMQVRAILEAACDAAAEGVTVLPEIMIPLSMTKRELTILKEVVEQVKKTVFAEKGRQVDFMYGTMIELPRAAVKAGELAEVAEFFSFGTNDLTQTTLGISRDDAGRFLGDYVKQGIFTKDPFQSLDTEGAGALVEMGCERGRKTRPAIKLGVCGEHGGDPSSIRFFHKVGLDYVSCSPFRVPIARLAAAQAAIEDRGTMKQSRD